LKLNLEKYGKNLAKSEKLDEDEMVLVERNSESVEISSHDILPGDIIYLWSGAKVFADIILIKTTDLVISRIGSGNRNCGQKFERKEIEKKENIQGSKENSLLDAENAIFYGDSVFSGDGKGLVIRTGDARVFYMLDGSLKFVPYLA
jgi:P-type Mg2+ transporter